MNQQTDSNNASGMNTASSSTAGRSGMKHDDLSIVEADGLTINLYNRHFAALLGLMFPGAGHYYQGRKSKAALFAGCILGLFVMGLYLGDSRVVYMSWKPEDYRLQYPAQMCVGLPALPAILHANAHPKADFGPARGRSGLNPPRPLTWKTFMAPPEDSVELSRWHYLSSAGFELGTLMTAVAGLLNILAVFDALAGPIAPLPAGKRKKEDES